MREAQGDLKIGRREATVGLIMSILAMPLTLSTTTADARDFEPLWKSAQSRSGTPPSS